MKKIKLLLLVSMILGAGSLAGEQFFETQSFSWREFHGVECIAFAVHFFVTLWLVLATKRSNLLRILLITSLFQLVTNPWEDIQPWNNIHAGSVLLGFFLTVIVVLKTK